MLDTAHKPNKALRLMLSFCVGTALCLFALYSEYIGQHAPSNYIQVVGTTVGTTLDSYSGRLKPQEFYVLKFTTENGKVVEVKSHTPIPSIDSPKLGEKIIVYYNKNNPEDTWLPSEDLAASRLIGIIGLLFLYRPIKYFIGQKKGKK